MNFISLTIFTVTLFASVAKAEVISCGPEMGHQLIDGCGYDYRQRGFDDLPNTSAWKNVLLEFASFDVGSSVKMKITGMLGLSPEEVGPAKILSSDSEKVSFFYADSQSRNWFITYYPRRKAIYLAAHGSYSDEESNTIFLRGQIMKGLCTVSQAKP